MLNKKDEKDKGKDKDKETTGFNVPCLKDLKDKYNDSRSHYAKAIKKMQILDAIDDGYFWDLIRTKFQTILEPDTNYISYTKSNLLASLYTVIKTPSILTTSERDKDIVMQLNIAVERIWALSKVGHYQMLAGERAALFNVGYTQVGWDEEVTGSTYGEFYKGNVVLKNIDPLKFRRDPHATSLDTAQYCLTIDRFHINILGQNPLYKEEIKKYKEERDASQVDTSSEDATYFGATSGRGGKGYVNLVIYWIKNMDGTIDEIHTVNTEYVLHYKKDIKPSAFPFAMLCCNIIPDGKLIGTSEPAKILSNYMTYNILDATATSAEYKAQNPPKYINVDSGLNVAQVAKYGDKPNYTFLVRGDATKAVHYHEYPDASTNIPKYKQDLAYGMQEVTGVDGRYTGRDTGSVITTGGMEDMLNRVTLVDTPKIANYEEYSLNLARLIIANLIEHAPTRDYLVADPTNPKAYKIATVPFPEIKKANAVFDYEISISSELPKNKARLGQMATEIMEKQMQYNKAGMQVELITPQEWLMFQDIPNKEFMLERMGLQRQRQAIEEVAQVLFNYSTLVENGMDPQSALGLTAQELDNARRGLPPGEAIPQQVGMAGAPQVSPTDTMPDVSNFVGTESSGQLPPTGGINPEDFQ